MKSIEDDNMEEIKKWIGRCEEANKTQCEKASTAPDDPDLGYARRKLEVMTLRKGINGTLYRAV